MRGFVSLKHTRGQLKAEVRIPAVAVSHRQFCRRVKEINCCLVHACVGGCDLCNGCWHACTKTSADRKILCLQPEVWRHKWACQEITPEVEQFPKLTKEQCQDPVVGREPRLWREA
jgi:hypothetical protein